MASQITIARSALLLAEAQTRAMKQYGLNIGSGRKPMFLLKARAEVRSQVKKVKARARAKAKAKIAPRPLLILRYLVPQR